MQLLRDAILCLCRSHVSMPFQFNSTEAMESVLKDGELRIHLGKR